MLGGEGESDEKRTLSKERNLKGGGVEFMKVEKCN